MSTTNPALAARPAWKALAAHHEKIRDVHLRQLFADDPKRGERLTLEAAGLFLDYSKNRVTDETLALLLRLAGECGLRQRIDAMFRGDKINITEDRAVLHVALRAPRAASIVVDGQDVVPEVHAVLDKMADFSDRVRSGAWKGHTGKRIRNVVNIGIGGSDLGPVMAYEALRHYSDRTLTFRFVSNVDGTDFVEATRRPRPGGNAVHRRLEDLHDAGDDDQRAERARLVAAGLRQRRRGRGQALRRRLDQCREGLRVRDRHGQHVRLLGLGRRAVLDGLGDRPLDDAGHRPGQLPRPARRLPPDGRALPHRTVREEPAGADGPAVVVVHRLLRRPDRRRPAVRAVPEAIPGLSAAVDDGEQRQARHARRVAGSPTTRARSTGASRGPTASTPSTS